MFPIKLMVSNAKINSNHLVLKINALEAGVPKSFSIKVAMPIAAAKTNSNKAVSFVENKMFLMELSIDLIHLKVQK